MGNRFKSAPPSTYSTKIKKSNIDVEPDTQAASTAKIEKEMTGVRASPMLKSVVLRISNVRAQFTKSAC